MGPVVDGSIVVVVVVSGVELVVSVDVDTIKVVDDDDVGGREVDGIVVASVLVSVVAGLLIKHPIKSTTMFCASVFGIMRIEVAKSNKSWIS